jgi:hypothetical protein
MHARALLQDISPELHSKQQTLELTEILKKTGGIVFHGPSFSHYFF